MKELKVWGGLTLKDGKQVRTIIATYTKKKARELLDISVREFDFYWSVTGNEIEVPIALDCPETILTTPLFGGKNFTAENKK